MHEREALSLGAQLVAEYIAGLPSFPAVYVKLRTLASELNRSPQQARRYLRELERHELLARAPHFDERWFNRQCANDYWARLPEDLPDVEREPAPRARLSVIGGGCHPRQPVESGSGPQQENAPAEAPPPVPRTARAHETAAAPFQNDPRATFTAPEVVPERSHFGAKTIPAALEQALPEPATSAWEGDVAAAEASWREEREERSEAHGRRPAPPALGPLSEVPAADLERFAEMPHAEDGERVLHQASRWLEPQRIAQIVARTLSYHDSHLGPVEHAGKFVHRLIREHAEKQHIAEHEARKRAELEEPPPRAVLKRELAQVAAAPPPLERAAQPPKLVKAAPAHTREQVLGWLGAAREMYGNAAADGQRERLAESIRRYERMLAELDDPG